MNIGLLGFGVVGGGVWELAQENRALNVKKVLVRREAPSLGKAAVSASQVAGLGALRQPVRAAPSPVRTSV